MNHCHRGTFTLSAFLLAIAAAVPLGAQPPAEQPGLEPEAPGAEAPAPQSAAVRAILAADPSDPPSWTRAAGALADHGRPDLAKEFLKRVIDAKLDQGRLAALAERLGSPMFVRFATLAGMQPEGKQLARAVLDAAETRRQDRQRLVPLVEQLQDPSAETRCQALADLMEAREDAVVLMIDVLADADRADEHANVRVALAKMGPDAIGPLLGSLEAADAQLRIQAIKILAHLDSEQAIAYLLRPAVSDGEIGRIARAALVRLVGHAPSRDEAIRTLAAQAEACLSGDRPIPADADGRVQLWRWDAEKKQCTARECSTEDAARIMAARLARDAYALAPNDQRIRRLYLTALLEEAEDPETAAAEAGRFGTKAVEEVLQYAIANDHVAAAAAAAEILGRTGSADELLYQGPRPAPLARATGHPDRRVRLAATEAIVRLHPSRLFPGASHVPDSLAFFAACRGTPRALVAGPSTQDSRELVGKLAQLGYEVDTAVIGMDLIRLAEASPEYEMVLIDVRIERPRIDLLVQRLRHDCRTADLRVGLIARDGYLPLAERVARNDPMAMAFPRPHTDEAVAWQVGRLSTLAPRTFVLHSERMRQAARALGCLAEISRPDGPRLYDVRRAQDAVLTALYVPELSIRAVGILGHLPTAQSQRALVELASRPSQPLEVRQAAVAAFSFNTQQKHRILLTTEELSRQYGRYKRSGNLDADTQQVLGRILDAIEAPTAPVSIAKPDDEGEGEAEETESPQEPSP